MKLNLINRHERSAATITKSINQINERNESDGYSPNAKLVSERFAQQNIDRDFDDHKVETMTEIVNLQNRAEQTSEQITESSNGDNNFGETQQILQHQKKAQKLQLENSS